MTQHNGPVHQHADRAGRITTVAGERTACTSPYCNPPLRETGEELIARNTERLRREGTAQRVAEMVRRAVLRELESESPENQIRIVAFRPPHTIKPFAAQEELSQHYAGHSGMRVMPVVEYTAYLINPAPEDGEKPLVITSRYVDDAEYWGLKGDEEKGYREKTRYQTIARLFGLVAEKVYGKGEG